MIVSFFFFLSLSLLLLLPLKFPLSDPLMFPGGLFDVWEKDFSLFLFYLFYISVTGSPGILIRLIGILGDFLSIITCRGFGILASQDQLDGSIRSGALVDYKQVNPKK